MNLTRPPPSYSFSRALLDRSYTVLEEKAVPSQSRFLGLENALGGKRFPPDCADSHTHTFSPRAGKVETGESLELVFPMSSKFSKRPCL